jgi:hypothetical protein
MIDFWWNGERFVHKDMPKTVEFWRLMIWRGEQLNMWFGGSPLRDWPIDGRV